MEGVLLQATIYLAAAVIAVPVAARLGFGSVLGYLAAGVIIGPVLGLVGGETEDLQHFAEFGVALMLFLIGLEVEPRALWAMRSRLVGLGGLQIALTSALVAAGAALLGLGWRASVATGFILAMSSTAIVMQTLTERRLLRTGGGRSAFAVLLAQDIVVIPILALMPLLASPDLSMGALGEGEQVILDRTLPGWVVTLSTLGLAAAVFVVGVYLTRPLFHFIHRARLGEMYTAFALLIVIGTALLMELVGLSPALGTFMAGVVLANSEFRHELEADIAPFKGLLLGLFFITVGAGADLGLMASMPLTILSLAAGIMALKAAILLALGRVFGLRLGDLRLFTLSLAQAGEFGFVLLSFSLAQGVLQQQTAQTLLAAITVTMMLAPLGFIANAWLARRARRGRGDRTAEADAVEPVGPVIIAGVGRFGQTVNRLVQSVGLEAVVLDNDIRMVQLMRRFGYRAFFGDPTRPDLLQAAGLDDARILVVSLDGADKVTALVAHARRQRPDLYIIARAYDRAHVFRLYTAGADKIVREVFDSSVRAGRYVLERSGFTNYESAEAARTFYHLDREGLRALAELWDPDIPISRNDAYIARARELESDLETEMLELRERSERSDA